MRIAIIGAGNVGGALGRAWLAAGHEVIWGVRDPARYPDLPAGRLADPAVAAKGADAIVLATPWPATEAAIVALGDLTGRTVIDTTNPLRMGADGLELALGFDTSAGELVAGWAAGAHVYKTLNTTGSGNMDSARRYATPPVMFVAGDHDEGKPAVMGLVADLGFEPVDAGPLRTARLMEPMAMLWIEQALKRGWGPGFAFVVERQTTR
jgi:predicted dinucleotide-binding enzyme